MVDQGEISLVDNLYNLARKDGALGGKIVNLKKIVKIHLIFFGYDIGGVTSSDSVLPGIGRF